MIAVGTAGYSYKDWIGPFYPEGTREGDMLEYYCSKFDFVEINSSYYHMPRLQLFSSIDKRTPDSFKVAVKLFQGFTHTREMGNSEEAEKFIYAISPIIESNKLVCILAQFPHSFHYNEENFDQLKRLREWFKDININVEFRSQDWIRKETMDLLKGEELGFVCVDEPSLRGLIRNVTACTSRTAYVRMHGRNSAKWYGGEGSERYDYLYDLNELKEWVPRIRQLESDSLLSLISFNNHPMGKAIENARMMAKLLKSRGIG
jgi:uncharacterized protein YecE (DUF72 family)